MLVEAFLEHGEAECNSMCTSVGTAAPESRIVDSGNELIDVKNVRNKEEVDLKKQNLRYGLAHMGFSL